MASALVKKSAYSRGRHLLKKKPSVRQTKRSMDLWEEEALADSVGSPEFDIATIVEADSLGEVLEEELVDMEDELAKD